MSRRMFAKKPLSKLLAEAEGERRLRRVLGPLSLTSLGVGAIIGTGIFVLTGVAAHDKTGPALVVSFVVAGITCVFAALCYAEFASMVPVAGSAYTYAYATLGELFAWIIGWDLVLEYAVAAATVAHGWSHYAQDILNMAGMSLPLALRNAPIDYDAATGHLAATGSILDLPALLITALMTAVLVRGIRESAALNMAMVIMKVAVVLFVIVAGAFFVRAENYRPFAPYGWGGLGIFGHVLVGEAGPGGQPRGMLAGAATIFFAYIGFDAVSVQAEEANNPKRDVPIGILASLGICTTLYMAVSAVLTGMVRYDRMNVDAPVSHAFAAVGLSWAQLLIALGAIAGITSVLLVMMLSQPRILMAMARDGLLPMRFFSDIHPRFRTPWKSTVLTGIAVAGMGTLLPLRVLAELVNIGTLLAFVIVCAAVMVMRRTHPHAERPFRAPGGAAVPILGIVCCLLLMLSLPWENWVRLVVWLLVGFLIYFGYGRRHSVLGRGEGAEP